MKKEYRTSTISERKEFYESEFSIKKIKKWFKDNKMKLPQLCALDPGTKTGIMKNKEWKDTLFYFEFKDLKKKVQKYLPEGVYYDRNVYKNPKKILENFRFKQWIKQELAFDLDADNIKCICSNNKKICDECINKVYKQTKKMEEELKKIGFSDLKIVYSGRGFHIHVLNKKAYLLNSKERKNIANKFKKYPIDPWVSIGYIRLIRMPYSLNGIVSRVVYPIKRKFTYKKTIPKFLKD
jgi:predicted DNA primase small subunit